MKFKYKQPYWYNILIFLVMIAQAVVAFLSLCRIFNWFNMYTVKENYEIFQICLSVFLFVFCCFLLSVNYKFKKGKVCVMLGFIDLFRGKFIIDEINQIVVKSDTNLLFVQMNASRNDAIININIDSKKYDAFAAEIKKYNKNVLYIKD